MISIGTRIQIAYAMWKDFMKQTFGSGVMFPTLAPSFQPGYSK